MLFNNLLTYGRRKSVRRIAAALLVLFVVLMPVQNVLTTPVVSVAHAQATTATFCSHASTCLTSIVYLFAVYIPTNFAYAAAYLFNGGLQLALNSASYALNFLSLGWTVVRDIANLTFIFILIYIAYIIIMRAESSGTMRMLAWVVAMALLINFSFFITRTVIDAGNILSVQFYNAIDIPNSIPSPLALPGAQSCPPNCIKDLTGGIMDAVKVQTILSDTSFDAFMNRQAANGVGTFVGNVLIQTLVFVSVGIFMSLLGFIFLIVGIKFIVRIVVLWLTIIASPLAFAAHALPNNKKVMGYYQMWQDNLIQSAFYPAVFLFLFFIMNLFLKSLAGNTGLVPSIFGALAGISDPNVSAAQAGITIIANIGIRMGLVIVLLYFAMKASDAFSSMGSGFANSVVSWTGSKAANMTAGTSSWLARNSAGRLANTAARSQTVRDWAGANPLYGGRLASGALNKLATSNLDARGIGGLKSLAGKAGFSLSGPSGAGGYRKQEADRAAAAEKFAKGLKSDAVYMKENALSRGKAAYDEANGRGATEILEKIKKEGAEATQAAYEKDFDARNGVGAFQRRIQKLDQHKNKAESDIANYERDAEKARNRAAQLDMENKSIAAQAAIEEAKKHEALAAEAQTVRSDRVKELDQERGAGKQQYENAEKMVGGGFVKLGEITIKAADKQRIEKAADYEQGRRFGNAYIPSVGNVEGAMKMRAVMNEKSKKEKAMEAAADWAKEEQSHANDHTEGTAPTPAKASSGGTAKTTPAPSGGGHDTGHHMTLGGIRAATQHYGSNEAAGDEILEKIKRLDLRMKNVQENSARQSGQMGDVQQSLGALGKTVQRQQSGPTTFGKNEAGKGAIRPTANTTVVGNADKENARQMPTDRGREGVQGRVNELSESIVNERAQTPEAPSSNDVSNPPKSV